MGQFLTRHYPLNKSISVFSYNWLTVYWKFIKENESPDENELVDGLRNILNKQKESHSEDSWYNDITKLLKSLNIPLKG